MPSLTRAEAQQRVELIDVGAYRIELDLTGAVDTERFESTTTVRFACATPGAATFVELKGAELIRATLNGVPLDPATLAENRLPLPDLAASNELVVQARMAYSNTGEGLHRFTDPADGEVYCYAQTFLDDAQRVFACFDQPDLKAPVTLTVAAPPGWEVAANGPGRAVGPGRWEFVATQPLATYFVSLIAGPYHVRRDTHDEIPLAVYCRRGLAPDLDKDLDEILAVTRAGLDRLHELFGVRYPFDKFDQAFVPEFNGGAMENAGLVVLREEYLFRSAVADDQRESRAVTITHELAHMWFGDLVTMRWWDDLWLNESFAEYLGFRVVAEATRFRQAWTGFAVGRKSWGYAADQRMSTHPVAPDAVDDCVSALLNFDGISYAKGAAVLRQLAAWLGDGPFLAGLRAHVRAHAYGNASLDDLLAALGESSGRDLTAWATRWLRRAQVNTLRPETVVGPDGCYQSVTVEQTAPPGHPTLRPQRIGIGVYSGGSRRAGVLVDLDPDNDGGRTPVPGLVGVPAGMLLLNDGDLGYAKVRFDGVSRAALVRTVPGLTDPLARALIWAAVADAVRDADVPVTDFVELFVAGIAAESEVTVVRDLLRFATVRAIDAQSLLAGLVARFLPPAAFPSAEARIARACRAALAVADPADGRRILLARGYVAAAGPAEAEHLRSWLDDPRAADIEAVEVDAELRWAILARLAALGLADETDIATELDRDLSASGTEHAVRCRAARPDPEAKAAAWRTIMEDGDLSGRLVTAAAEGLWHPGQADLMESYVERYFAEMPRLAGRRSPATVAQVATAAFPRFSVTADTVQRATALTALPGLDPTLRRVVQDHADELRRGVAGRSLVPAEGVGVGAAGGQA